MVCRKFSGNCIRAFLLFFLLPATWLWSGCVSEKEKKNNPVIVFLITEDSLNYEAHLTIPVFAEELRKEKKYEVHVLQGTGSHGSNSYPDFKQVERADLVVVFSRRVAMPVEQLNILKAYLQKGKPLMGIRTANHAFTPRTPVESGFEAWPEFVADILGCENRGYGPVEPGTEVSVNPEQQTHPVLKDISVQQWHSDGNVYLVAPLLDSSATVLLHGKADGKVEPVAWTRLAGKSKVFYTSLGYPTDFRSAPFLTLLHNAISWSLEE